MVNFKGALVLVKAEKTEEFLLIFREFLRMGTATIPILKITRLL